MKCCSGCTVRLNAEEEHNGTMNRNNSIKIFLSVTIIIALLASFVQKQTQGTAEWGLHYLLADRAKSNLTIDIMYHENLCFVELTLVQTFKKKQPFLTPYKTSHSEQMIMQLLFYVLIWIFFYSKCMHCWMFQVIHVCLLCFLDGCQADCCTSSCWWEQMSGCSGTISQWMGLPGESDSSC